MEKGSFIDDLLNVLQLDLGDFTLWILQAIAIYLTAFFIPRLKITSFFGPILTVICLAFINSKAWDAALFFKLPDSITAQALTIFIINGVIFWILIKILPGIEIHGLMPALVAPIVFTATYLLMDYIVDNVDVNQLWQTLVEYLNKVKEYVTEDSVTVHTNTVVNP